MLQPPVTRLRGVRVILLAAAPVVLLTAAFCHDDGGLCPNPEANCLVTAADSVVIEPSSDSVVIEPAATGASAVGLAVDSVVIEPATEGRRIVRIYPQ